MNLRLALVLVALTGCAASGASLEGDASPIEEADAGLEARAELPLEASAPQDAHPVMTSGDDAHPVSMMGAPEASSAPSQDAGLDVAVHDEASSPAPDAAPAPYIRVRCLVEGGALFECDALADGGVLVRPGSNATIVFYPAAPLPPVTCSTSAAPSMVCPPGTFCLGETVSGGTLTSQQGVCE